MTQLLIVLDGTIVNIALPQAQTDLGLSDTARQWVVTAYALAFGALLLLGGRVADFWGRKRAYIAGLILFGAGSAWGGLATSATELLLARAAQGVSAALMAPAALAIVTVTFPHGRERNTAFAIFGSVVGAGSAVGLLLGGVLAEFFSWRWCLLVNVPLVIISVALGAALLSESRAEGDRRYDTLGAVTVAAGLGLLVYGLTLAEESWTAPRTIAALGLGVLFIALFISVESRSASPLLPLRVLKDKVRAAAFSLQALTGAVMIGAMLYMTFHLQLVLNMTPLQAGLATLPITVSISGTVPFATALLNRVGPRPQLVAGPLVSAMGMLLLSRISADGSYWSEVLPGIVLLGVGMGLTFVPLQNLALLGVEPRDAGAAAATANAANQIGGSIGLALVTTIYVSVTARAEDPVSSTAAVSGYSAVFLAAAVLLLASAALARALVRPGALDEAPQPQTQPSL